MKHGQALYSKELADEATLAGLQRAMTEAELALEEAEHALLLKILDLGILVGVDLLADGQSN